MKLRGLILCGGESKRMGRDKGLIVENGQPWVKIVSNLFEALGMEYFLSINASQEMRYNKFFSTDQFIYDAVDAPGPLRGILSAHNAFPENNWLILACDMIEMKGETIKNIIDKVAQNPDYEYWIYKNPSFFEPFCGVYSARGLHKLEEAYRHGDLSGFSMQNIFKHAAVFCCPTAGHQSSFKNFNQI